jgi:group II intron reverse transcriptase/maturase
VRSILEAYYEPQFSDHSHGFRPNRGCHTALKTIQNTWTATKWFIEGDIKGCFDNIDHTVLVSILREKIHDNRFIRLVENLLQAGYLEEWNYRPTLSGTPQGGIVSPVLANIYLDKLDRFIENALIPLHNKGVTRKKNPEYKRIASRLDRQRSKGVETDRDLVKRLRSLNAYDEMDPNYRRLRYVRYADDFILGFVGPEAEAEGIRDSIGTFLRDELKLELSPDKTLISHARRQPARFLGYDVSVQKSSTRRSVNGRIALRLPPRTLMEKASEYKKGGKPFQRPELVKDDDFTTIARYGSEFRGFVQYYKLAQNLCWCAYLKRVMQLSLFRTLASKHKTSVNAIALKYDATVLMPQGPRKCVRMVIEREGKPDLVAQFGEIPLTRSENTVLIDGPSRIIETGRNELLQRLMADRCELCGSSDGVQVHHVRKLADLNKPGRQELPLWRKMMSGRRRKTLVVCLQCHTDIHAGRPTRKPLSPVSTTGEPDEAKVSRPVRRGDDGKGA